MNNAGMNKELAMDATGLTQLSSREQLSALMDGALPADETRFLLRRLQHDGSLAECWERWRLSAEVMRGLAPAQRLPADFASRVAASIRDEQRADGTSRDDARPEAAASAPARRAPAWLRWSGRAAVAASLAVIAFMTQPVALESPANLPGNTVVAAADSANSLANDTVALSQAPAKTSGPQAPVQDPVGAGLESQTAALASVVAVATARSNRGSRVGGQVRSTQAASMLTAANDAPSVPGIGIAAAGDNIPPLLPPSDIVTRPWPRSVLPHAGSAGLTVGFGDGTRDTAPYNPFQMRTTGLDNLPPALMVDTPANESATPANDDAGRAANQPQPRRSQP